MQKKIQYMRTFYLDKVSETLYYHTTISLLLYEVFTLLHEFLRIPPDSHWKVGILWNSMEFLWKAFGWSLSHLGFHFHGNSHFFPRNSNGNGQNPGASRNDSQWNPWDSIGIPLEFRGKQL